MLNLLQATYDGFILLVETKLFLTDLSSFLQEHKVSGGPLKSIALFTSARLSVQPVTEGTLFARLVSDHLATKSPPRRWAGEGGGWGGGGNLAALHMIGVSDPP